MYRLTGLIGEFFLKWSAKKKRISYAESTVKQNDILFFLIKKNVKTQFGIDHNFENIRTINEYQKNVKPRDYSDFWNEYWKRDFPNLVNVTWTSRIPYFAKTSGTTSGKSKYIPCTLEMVKANNKAGLQVLVEHFRNAPKSKILRGRYFMFAGSPNLEQLDENVFAGELSGIAARETPKWAGRERYYPSQRLAQITDWKQKIETISIDCLDKNIRAISGLPSWLQLLFLRIFKDNPVKKATLKTYFPDLNLLVHGGMSFEPYQKYFEEITNGESIDFREIYAASEGFFAVSDRKYGEGLRLITDNGIFYEFIKFEDFKQSSPKRFWLENVENNVDYVLLVTTCAGLWSYVVGDIIRFTDYENLRLLFSGRLSQTLSMFGEKVLNEEVETAIAQCLKSQNLTLRDFSVFPSFLEEDSSKGIHTYMIELEENADGIEEILAAEIDKNLIAINSGYATRRNNNISIVSPKVILCRNGLFEDWMKSKGKTGGQHKVPRVIKHSHKEELMSLNK